MQKINDILDQPTIYSGTTSSRSITKGDTMNEIQIREELKTLTNSDSNQLRDIAYALNLLATNRTLLKAVETNAILVSKVAYELEFMLSE
jgi:hypothetical protein